MGNFKNIGDIAGSLENDLEQIGMTMCPQIKTIKDILMESRCFGRFDERKRFLCIWCIPKRERC